MNLHFSIFVLVSLLFVGRADIITSGNNTLNECDNCQATLAYLRGIASLGDGAFVKVVQQSCGESLLRHDDDDVCKETVALQGPILADTLRKVDPTSRAGILLCIGLMGRCEYPRVLPLDISLPTHCIPGDLAAPKKLVMSERPVNPKKPVPLRIAHFSDIHVDQLYTTGANANFSKPMCCRKYTIADEPGNNDAPAGPFGDHNCGAPSTLQESMYAAIQTLSPDFSIFTGDIVDHGIWNTSVDHNAMEIERAYRLMSSAGMQVVYSALGNHELSPANAFRPLNMGEGAEWLLNQVSKIWSRFIGTCAEDIRKFGRYSVRHPGSNLRVIGLNTNLYYTLNFWTYQLMDGRDPENQLQWLIEELDSAERQGERVYSASRNRCIVVQSSRDSLDPPPRYTSLFWVIPGISLVD